MEQTDWCDQSRGLWTQLMEERQPTVGLAGGLLRHCWQGNWQLGRQRLQLCRARHMRRR